jgi:chromosome segregation ATPase
MPPGLKKELGLGDPKGPQTNQGSTEQADKFKAAYQVQASKINESLQYTAAHAEKVKHDPFAAKRDKLCQAYQVALQRIDPKNPKVADGAIKQVLDSAQQLQTAVTSFEAEAKRDYENWMAQQSTFERLTTEIREVIEWEHPKGGPLQQVLDKVNSKSNERAYKGALDLLTELASKEAPIYEDYQKQKGAQEEYEPALAALQPKLDSTKTCEFKSLTPLQQSIEGTTQSMLKAATDKNYVEALAQLRILEGQVSDYETQLTDLKAKKAEFESARKAIEPKLTEASNTKYKSLAELDQPIADLTTQADTAATDEKYDEALAKIGELTTKVDEKIAAVQELEQRKAEYEAARKEVDPKLAQAGTCEFTKGFDELDQKITDLTTKTDGAATDEKYGEALENARELDTAIEEKLTKIEEVRAKKEEYESGLAAIKPRLDEASKSDARHAYLEPIQNEMITIQTEMEGYATAEEYEEAVNSLSNLTAKLDEYDAAIAAKKAEFDAAMKAAKAVYDRCFFLANSYKSLETDQKGLEPKLTAIQAAEKDEDYEKGKQLADELKTAAEAYMTKAAEAQKEFDQKAKDITKKLDETDELNREAAAQKIAKELTPDQIKHMPIEVRNRIMQEMEKGGFSTEDKKAMDELYKVRTLDPKFEEAERVKREEMTERLKSDPEFAEARKNWKTMSKDDKMKIFAKAAEIHSEVYGTKDEEPKMTMKETNTEPKKDAAGNVISWNNGAYNHRDGKFSVNTNGYSGVSFNNFDESIDLVVHEAGHRYQNVLADRLKRTDATQLKPTDPEYNQAVAFRINDPRYGYYKQPGDPWEVYYNQPMEAHSRESGAGVAKAGVDPHGHDHGHHH